MDKDFGMAGYRVYRSEIEEEAKRLRLWVRRKCGNRKLECSVCGRRISQVAEVYEREVRDLPWSEYRTIAQSSRTLPMTQFESKSS